jgi:hypothetical protein
MSAGRSVEGCRSAPAGGPRHYPYAIQVLFAAPAWRMTGGPPVTGGRARARQAYRGRITVIPSGTHPSRRQRMIGLYLAHDP